MDALPWTPVADGVRLTVKVMPRAKRSEWTGIVAIGEGKAAAAVRLAAPPVDGAANEALCAFLAKALGVSKASVTIRSGAASRIKQIDLVGEAPVLIERLGVLAGAV